MKDVIKNLSNQAHEYAREYVAECKHYGYYMDYNEYNIQFEKKFAELIVRESADILEVEYGISALSGNAAAKAVKEHFGVKDEQG